MLHFEVFRTYFTQGQQPATVVHLWLTFREKSEYPATAPYHPFVDTWQIFLHHPFAGTGLGTLQIVYPPYESLYDGRIVNHTHNDYLEALAETGVLGGLCCAWFLGVLFGESLKRLLQLHNSFAGALQLCGLVACVGFLVHSLVDFNLHIPSNALLFFLMAHLATTEMPSTPPLPAPGRPRHRDPANH